MMLAGLANDSINSAGSSDASAVELSAIEQQKENIQPLAAGRSAKALHALFTADRKQLHDELREGHEGFRKEIQQAEREGSDDPLDVYHRYVRWTLSSYPTGPSHASHLVPLLEEATRKFVHEEQYKSDVRLLKLWILYAKYIDCPRDIFRFLEGLQVGVTLASFYEEWAILEEQRNDYASAKAIYKLGIARRAQPLERLKKRRDAFQARMLLPRAEQIERDVGTEASNYGRTILGDSAGHTTSCGGHTAFKGNATSTASSRLPLANNGASLFAVFQDGDENGNPQQQQDGWNDVGTVEQRKKENIRQATSWNADVPFQQNALSASQSGNKIAVFRDDDAPLPQGVLTSSANGLSLSRSLRGPGEAELLRRDPFRNHTQAVVLANLPTSDSIALPEKTAPTNTLPSAGPSSSSVQSGSSNRPSKKSHQSIADTAPIPKRAERVASPLHDIYPDGANGPEYSFEEIYASRMGLRHVRSGTLEGRLAVPMQAWEIECRSSGASWRQDSSGQTLLRDPISKAPLFQYIRRQDEAEQALRLEEERIAGREAESARLAETAAAGLAVREADRARRRDAGVTASVLHAGPKNREITVWQDQVEGSFREAGVHLLSECSETGPHQWADMRSSDDSNEPAAIRAQSEERTAFRPPSPTINTKAALAEVNAMFSKTMRFDDAQDYDKHESNSDTEHSASDEDDFDNATPLPPSQAETDDTFWNHSQPASQSQSQQPFQSQSTMPSQSSLGTTSESGDTTEGSDSESDHIQQQQYISLKPSASESQLAMSRSSSSSSSASGQFEPFRPSRPRTTPFIPKKPRANAKADENSSFTVKSASAAIARAGMSTEDNQQDSAQPAFEIYREEPVSVVSSQYTMTNSIKHKHITGPSAQESPNDVSIDKGGPSAESETPGYALGRRIGGASAFANNVNIMTPIIERTCEFGMSTNTFPGNSSSSIQAFTVLADAETDNDGFDIVYDDLVSSRTSVSHLDRRRNADEKEVDVLVAPSVREDDIATNVKTNPRFGNNNTGSALPIDPLAPSLLHSILNDRDMKLSNLSGFVDRRSQYARKLDGLQKTAKSRRKSGGRRSSSVFDESVWELELDRSVFSVREKLGEGGFGAVFRVVELLDGEQDEDEDLVQTALKVESPANLWEFFILHLIHSRIAKSVRKSVIRSHRLYAYKDESHMLVDYCDQGTLLNAVNHAQEAGVGPAGGGLGFEEVVAMFFTVELSRVLEGFHDAGFLHGDFKIDNCLLRLDEVAGGARNWCGTYRSDGSGGWSSKGVCVIDFGRTIDLRQYADGQSFSTKWTTDKHDCPEMMQGRPWTYQPDYYGLACCAHVLLFGRYLETASMEDTSAGVRYAVKEPFKRYHQAALWSRFFDILLNPTLVNRDGSLPITGTVADVRREMEIWLEANSERSGKNLKHLLKKLEIQAMSSSSSSRDR